MLLPRLFLQTLFADSLDVGVDTESAKADAEEGERKGEVKQEM